MTTAAVSSPHHPRNTHVHLFLFKELTARDLIDSQLHLRIEPRFLREQAVHGIHNQLVWAAPGAGREAGKLIRLALGKLKFHKARLGGCHWHVKKSKPTVESEVALEIRIMSRNFYILAATLVLFALVSAGMSLVPSSYQPGLPANGTLWRTVALFLLLGGLGAALIGVMSHLFEQVDRRSEEARQAARRKRRGGQNP